MKIKFLGAAGQVTGSSYLLTSDSCEAILIDLGLFQGAKEVEKLNHMELDIDVKNILGVILTHAHLDHCGRLPLLAKMGYKKKIWMTKPTRDIAEISLFDTAKINEEYVYNDPLYLKEDVIDIIETFSTQEYDIPFKVGPFSVKFKDAGHILGSASVEIVDLNSESTNNKIVFSGDLGNSPEDLIRSTQTIKTADFVVVESTYGDRVHTKDIPEKILQEAISKIQSNQGTLLIPAFSIERSQEITHLILHLKRKNLIDKSVNIFFDSPMAERVTEVFELYKEYYNSELLEDLKVGDPFHYSGLNYIQNSRQSDEINNIEGAKIIIAGSGMMTGGRIVKHAQHLLPVDTTVILFVGYQSEGTLGRKILEGAKEVEINDLLVPVKAEVREIQALSSHADQPKLLEWLRAIEGVRKIFIIHGEDKAREEFKEVIIEKLNFHDIYIPQLNEEIDLK